MSECAEHDRCIQRDKAECEWCLSPATTPADPTDQIATTPAVLSPETPIVPTSGTKRVPDDSEAAVVQDAQQYDWRVDLDSIEACEDVWQCADGCCTNIDVRHMDECVRLAAHIERLEAERDALLAEHEAWRKCFDCPLMLVADNAMCHTDTDACPYLPMKLAHDNAERMIRG